MPIPVQQQKTVYGGTFEQYRHLPLNIQQRYYAPPMRSPIMHRRRVPIEGGEPQRTTTLNIYSVIGSPRRDPEWYEYAQHFHKTGQTSLYVREIQRLYVTEKITEEQYRKAIKATPAPHSIEYAEPPTKEQFLEMYMPKEPPKSVSQQIFEFDPFKFGQEIGATVFGIEGEKKIEAMKWGEETVGVHVRRIGEGTIFHEPQKSLAGVVASGEALFYTPFALVGIETPYSPTASGAIVSDVVGTVMGQPTGAMQHLEEEYGASYIAGTIMGDVLLSLAMGKAVSWIRGTKYGGKVLGPVMKPFDKLDDVLTKRVLTPVKTKVSSFYDDVVAKVTGKQVTQVTGWTRTGFGMKGYGFDEITAPKHGIVSPFKTTRPSVIVDDTGQQFMVQASRATSKPVRITSFEQTVYGRGGKPWIFIQKHPPSPIFGGGLSILVDPKKLAYTPSPMIVSLKTKISSQLFASTITKPSRLGEATLVGAIMGTSFLTRIKSATKQIQVPSIGQIQETGQAIVQIQKQVQKQKTIQTTTQIQKSIQQSGLTFTPPAFKIPPFLPPRYPHKKKALRRRIKSPFDFYPKLSKQKLRYPVAKPEKLYKGIMKFKNPFKVTNPFIKTKRKKPKKKTKRRKR